MKFITYQEYIEHLKKKENNQLSEKEEEYKISPFKNHEIYNEKKIKTIEKKHDKMFRNILSRKTEMTKFLNEFLHLKEKIQETEIVQCQTDFITKQHKNKHSDIIYKLREKPVYFLVEHQSTIDRDMPLRIWEYVGEIMRKESILQKTYLRKDKIYPVVVPIIVYTGFRTWRLKTNFAQYQYQIKNYYNYEINLNYNLIAVQNYSFEELFDKNTLFGSIMIIEKCREVKELNQQLDKIIEKMKDLKDLEAIAEIITNVIAFRMGEEKARKILEKITRKEELGMSPLTKMLLDLEYKNWKKGEKEGLREGFKKITKNMLESGESDEKIIKYTGISHEELAKIKNEFYHL